MKTFSFFLLALLLGVTTAKSQSFTSKKKGSLIGFGFNLVDFETPSLIKATSLSHVLKNGEWRGVSAMQPGFSLMYWKGLTERLDFSGRYHILFSDYSKDRFDNQITNEFEAALHGRLLTDDHTLNPFLTAGVGVGNYGKTWAPYSPLGIGLQLNLGSLTYIFLQADYRVSYIKSALDNNIIYSFGITENISKPKAAPPVKSVPIPIVEKKDRDNDGTVDSLDNCPDVAGLSQFNGCPDTDSDGIADGDDKCPAIKGTSKYQGCPIPDSDEDGINDENDKCPNEKGTVKYQGCPVPDQDNDGVDDENDKCPSLAGVRENNGCPEIKEETIKQVTYSAQRLFFATGSYKLLPKSFASLDAVAKILKEDSNLRLDIEGHTDSTGNQDKNLILSEQRAKAVSAYLAGKGIGEGQLSTTGYGSTQPVADNRTAAGRNKNRRVELKLKY